MAVIALTSASGSPGVTTTALGLALSWPRPVLLVEADPTGASGLLAGYFRGARYYESGLPGRTSDRVALTLRRGVQSPVGTSQETRIPVVRSRLAGSKPFS